MTGKQATRSRTAPPRNGQPERPARSVPKDARLKWKSWLVVSVLGCVIVLGGVIMLEGAGYFRDIERAESLVLTGWFVAAAVSIFITVAVGLLKKK